MHRANASACGAGDPEELELDDPDEPDELDASWALPVEAREATARPEGPPPQAARPKPAVRAMAIMAAAVRTPCGRGCRRRPAMRAPKPGKATSRAAGRAGTPVLSKLTVIPVSVLARGMGYIPHGR
jgi:hypothetical protein